uniref:Uncharacterized protein n=1 Tax=Acrobeloides nanus TaxID=290746 RepID=A0A914DF26_9BILA
MISKKRNGYMDWTVCDDGQWCPGTAKCYDKDGDGVIDSCTNNVAMVSGVMDLIRNVTKRMVKRSVLG